MIKRISYENFKGQTRVIDHNGKSFELLGKNGAGKTTELDAICWCLFGKALDRKSINPKPENDKNEKDIVDVIVELELMTGLKLKAVYVDKLKVVNGKQVNNGYTTDYYIGNAPVSQSEYKKVISELFSEEQFYISSVVGAFSQLEMKAKRKLLMNITTKPSLDDLAKIEPELLELQEIADMNDVELERFTTGKKLELKTANTKLNDNLKLIKERNEDIVTTGNKEELENKLKQLETVTGNDNEITTLQTDIINLDTYAKKETAEINKKYQSQIEEQTDICKVAIRELKLEIDKLTADKESEENNVKLVKRAIADNEYKVKSLNRQIINDNDNKKELNENYLKIKSIKIDGICFNCSQKLPDEMIAEQQNIKKTKIDKLIKSGNDIDEKVSDTKSEIEEIEQSIKKQTSLISGREIEISDIKTQISKLDSKRTELTQKRQAKTTEIEQKQAGAISNVNNKLRAEKQTVLEQIQALLNNDTKSDINAEKIAEIKAEIEKIATSENSAKRIETLEKENNVTGQKIDELTKIIALLNLRQRTYIGVIESELNNIFSIARFKMFEKLVKDDESYREVCEVLFNGKQTMSTGESMLVGIDICNGFAKSWNIETTLLIDNGQDLTSKFETDRQYLKCITTNNATLEIEEV